MNWKIGIPALLLLLLPAYAGNAASKDPAQKPGTYQSHDMAFSWDIHTQADTLVIKGMAQNTFHYRIYRLQLYAIPLDEQGKPTGKEVAFLGPDTMELDQKVPFTLTIPVGSSATPKNIRLEYRFHLDSFTGEPPWNYGKFLIPVDGTS